MKTAANCDKLILVTNTVLKRGGSGSLSPAIRYSRVDALPEGRSCGAWGMELVMKIAAPLQQKTLLNGSGPEGSSHKRDVLCVQRRRVGAREIHSVWMNDFEGISARYYIIIKPP